MDRTGRFAGIIVFLFLGFSVANNGLPESPAEAAPVAPTRLIFPENYSIVKSTTPTFRWKKVSGAGRYALFISKYPYGPENLVYRSRSLAGMSFKIPEGFLADGERYCWNMRAGTKSRWSDYSDSFCFLVHLKTGQEIAAATPPPVVENTVISESVKNDSPVVNETEPPGKKEPPAVPTAREWYQQGNAALVRREFDIAVNCYTEAVKLDTGLSMAYYNRGFVYAHKKEYDNALADFDRALKSDPTFPEAYYKRGTVYGAEKEYDKALADFDRAILLDPGYAEAYYGRALVYCAKKEYRKALTDIKKSRDLGFPGDQKMVESLVKAAGEKEE